MEITSMISGYDAEVFEKKETKFVEKGNISFLNCVVL